MIIPGNGREYPQYQLNLIDDAGRDRLEIKSFFASMLDLLQRNNQFPWLLDLETQRKFEWCQACTEAFRSPHADVNFLITNKVVPYLLEEMRQPSDVRKSFDVFVPEHLPNLIAFNEVIERRKICRFLCDFEEVLQKNNHMTDDTTNHLIQWHHIFVERLSRELEGSQSILEDFAAVAADLLLDPFSVQTYIKHLDKKALLGSDGHTYGKKSLCIFLSLMPENLRHKPPLDPDSPVSFTTSEHPIVRYLITWLESRDFIFPNTLRLEEDYNNLKLEGKVPMIPTKASEKIRLKNVAHIQRNREILRRLEEQEQRNLGGEAVMPVALEAFGELRRQFENGRDANFDRIGAMEQFRGEDLQLLQLQGQAHHENVQILDEHIAELNENLAHLQGDVEEVKREIIQLKIEVAELARQAAKRRNGFFQILTQVALCALTTWAMGYLLPPNISGALMKSGRGAKIMLNVKF
nr:hypothetical protein [Parachlamydiaceae bacterium]